MRADQLELPFLVLHPGAHLGAGEEAGLAKRHQLHRSGFRGIPKVKTRLALETTAGQGSCLGERFEHLAAIIENVREPERLCVCLDTAHVFAAGYDIGSEDVDVKKMFAEFDRIIGLDRLAALHLNDSKTRPRLPRRSARAHREREDRSRGVPVHHARPPIPQNPESPRNAQRQRPGRGCREYENAAKIGGRRTSLGPPPLQRKQVIPSRADGEGPQEKLPIPSPKLQRNSQAPTFKSSAASPLMFGPWSFFGAWMLELGASADHVISRMVNGYRYIWPSLARSAAMITKTTFRTCRIARRKKPIRTKQRIPATTL